MDALFTATSCTCGTGHSTVDVEATFTVFGKVVMMILIQIGGLRSYASHCTYNDVATAKR